MFFFSFTKYFIRITQKNKETTGKMLAKRDTLTKK
jgi:hypothetical protein